MGFLSAWRALGRFRRLPSTRRAIVFYSEGRSNWPHLEPLVTALLARPAVSLCYVSSHDDDPGIALDHPRLDRFVIGEGMVRTVFFQTLRAGLCVMTMPDLETFHIKRSPHGVHYVYVHHSLVSTHMVYRPAAFDAFDTVFCSGPHHVIETRTRESLFDLPAKQLVEHGYGRLDGLLATSAAGPVAAGEGRKVLVAPSWGPHCLFETVGGDLIAGLLASGWTVVARPHPETLRRSRSCIDDLVRRFGDRPEFTLDIAAAGGDTLLAAAVMISDWSGAAFDFALALERPVLFIDVPRKVNNPDWQRLGLPPLEETARSALGELLPLDALASASARLQSLFERREAVRLSLRAARQRWVYNPGTSGSAGAEALLALAERRKP